MLLTFPANMDIIFREHKLQKTCNNFKELSRRFGDRMAKVIRRRLDDLRAASCLEHMKDVPGRCHELRGDRAEQISLDLVHPKRLLFVAANNPIPRKPDGGLDWTNITAVEILGMEDTHG